MKAFTLVETLVAISIITIAITGPFQVVQSVLQSSYIARDELIATGLGQEGMEYVRAIRDGNALYNNHHNGGRTWLQGLDTSSTPDCYTNACVVDVGQQTAQSCGAVTCAATLWPLYLASNGLYNQGVGAGAAGTGTVTRFTRQIRLTSISATETRVTVTVSWTYRGTHQIVLIEDLHDWL